MVKFSDINKENINSAKPIRKKERSETQDNSRLSFRKLAAEQKNAPSADEVVFEKKDSDKDQIGESGKVLYQKAADYLKQAVEAVKRRKMFSLEEGFQIIREMVGMQSFQDSLFIEALHFDDPLQFIIHNNVNVAIYAIKMAENLDWSKDRQIEIGMAGLLHDIGMAVIPEKLIYKRQKLSEAEFKIFQERSNYSYKILKSLEDDYAYLAECAVQANERRDGSGYPQGLEGDEIDEYAQIIGLVDMYEALIHSRPQRGKFLHFTAVKEIIKSGKHLFQRKHLKALLNIFSIFPLQSCVRLNSNAIGRVIETYPDLPMRPRIQVVFDSQQRRVLTERIVNLPDDPLLYIVDSVADAELQSFSKGSDSETRVQADRVPKDDDWDSFKTDAAVVVDELTPETGEKDDQQTGLVQKTGWFKTFLIITAIILLGIGLIIQFGNIDPKPVVPVKVQRPVMKKIPDSSPLKETSAVSLPAKDENHIRQDVFQEKPLDFRSPGPNDPGSSGEVNVPELTKESGITAGNLTFEEPASDNEQKPVSATSFLKTETLEIIGESEQGAESVKQGAESVKQSAESVKQSAESVKLLYPYSIKLTYFRSREVAEKSLAVYRAKGLSPYWVKVNLGDQGVWYRVFAGYFEDIDGAEEIIKTHKLHGALVRKTAFAALIGTYRSELEVNTQIQQISEQGYSPYVIKGADGECYLYVGAFNTRKGAKEQYADLLASGIESKMVERYSSTVKETSDNEQKQVSATSSLKTETLKMSGESKKSAEFAKLLYPYSIKLYAARTLTEAQKFIAVYRQKGLSPYWVNVDLGDRGVWYRVFTGYFENIEQAENIIKTKKLTNAKAKKTKYAMLIGTYRTETTLNDQIQLISEKGFSPYVVKAANGESYLYVGAFYTYKGAKEQYADLLAGGIEGKVVER